MKKPKYYGIASFLRVMGEKSILTDSPFSVTALYAILSVLSLAGFLLTVLAKLLGGSEENVRLVSREQWKIIEIHDTLLRGNIRFNVNVSLAFNNNFKFDPSAIVTICECLANVYMDLIFKYRL